MSDGDATLEQMIDSLLRTPEALQEAMPKLAAVVKRALVEANQAGVSPDGKPYQRTLEGHVPLRNGSKAIAVTFSGLTIRARVRGVEARHSLGTARGRIERRMLPEGAPSEAMQTELRAVAERFLREVLG